ncbi:MAG: STAS domain-containing protein [Spirochaetes bacterium]|nr:STAS domain-containing protein [Spirochaetota bacterium]
MPVPALDISIKKTQKYNLVTLKGRLDASVFQNFVITCLPLVENNHLVIDFTDVDYVSSTGIGALFKLLKLAHNNKKKLVFFGVQPTVKKVITLTKLENMFNIVETLDESLKLL